MLHASGRRRPEVRPDRARHDRSDGTLGNARGGTYTVVMANGSLPPETVALGPAGEVRLPQALLSRLGWREGDRLVVSAEESGELKVLTIRDAVHGLRG